MLELSFEYLNKLSTQLILISSLLGGFSLAMIVSLLNSRENNRITRNLIRTSTIAAASFIITIFSMTKILLMTTPGFPNDVVGNDLTTPRAIGGMTFLLGIIALFVFISLSGWRKSRQMGIFTLVVGIVSMILLLLII